MVFPAGRNRLYFCLLAILSSIGTGRANTLNYSNAAGDLNVATFDSSNNVVQGVTTFTIQVPDLALEDAGDSLMVSLVGLLYPYAGDLHVTLTNPLNVTGDVFDHIGALVPGDPGYPALFGDSIVPCSGNYNFDSGYSGDLWGTAAQTGSGESIQCGNYVPTAALSAANDNLSFLFAGMPINGIWTLTIYDDYPPFNGDIGTFTPGLSSWGLTLQTASATTPEPSSVVSVALSALLLSVVRRKLRS